MIRDTINRTKKIIKSRDGKALLENFSYLSLLQIAGYIFPFITIPYLSRIIGVEGFGRIAFAASIVAWIQTFVDWGFGFSATREVAKNRENKQILSQIFSDVLWTKLFIALICLIVLVSLICFIPAFHDNAAVLLITFLLIPGHILFPDWFFQGMEKMKYSSLFNIGIKLFFTIAVFFVVKQKEDYIFQPLLTSIGYIISGLAACIMLKKIWNIRLQKPKFHRIIESLQRSFDIFIGNLFPTMYNNFSAVLLGVMGTPVANGIYDGGNKFVTALHGFTAILNRIFYPFLCRRSDKHSLYARFNLTVVAIMTIILFLVAPLLIHVFLTKEFEDSIVVLRILSLSIFFQAVCAVYGVNYLYVKGHDREARNITIIASIIGFLLAYPMIKWGNYIGAAINVAFARALLACGHMVAAKRHILKRE